MNTSVVAGLEQQLDDAKSLIERRNLALKLSSNREFRKLVLEGFCEKDCARFAAEAGDPALDVQQRADAMEMAKAGGHLKRYLSAAFMMGAAAERDVAELEEALAEARAEEDVETSNDDNSDNGGELA
jgi:precorrin-6B methylase 1